MSKLTSILANIFLGPTQEELERSRLLTLREMAQRKNIDPEAVSAQFQLICRLGVIDYALRAHPPTSHPEAVRLAIAYYVGAESYDPMAQRLRSALGIARASRPLAIHSPSWN